MTKTKTKQIKAAYHSYLRSNYYSLRACYGNYSTAKENAFKYCLTLLLKYNGLGLKIIGFNSQTFSVGFIGEIDGKKAFFYITKSYNRYCFIDDLEI